MGSLTLCIGAPSLGSSLQTKQCHSITAVSASPCNQGAAAAGRTLAGLGDCSLLMICKLPTATAGFWGTTFWSSDLSLSLSSAATGQVSVVELG